MPDGKVGIRIVKFGFVRHLFSLLAQQVSGVQADVRIVNQNARNKTRRTGLSAGALRMPDTSEVARISPPPGLLLLRFVSCEDSDLRLAGSESYLAEVFPRYQCRHYDG